MIKKFYVSRNTEGTSAPELDRFQRIEKLNLLLSSGWTIKSYEETGGESWFLFIRYHRSILGVDWTLTTDYNSKDVIDIMTFGDDTTAEDRAKEVSARQKELMEEHPGCTIDLEYEYSKPTTVEDNDDAIHLLWVSDRLAIAREVDHKLTKIYANLVLLEKYLYSKQSIESFLKGKLNSLFEDDAWQHRNGNAAFRRWRESTYKAINKSNDKNE